MGRNVIVAAALLLAACAPTQHQPPSRFETVGSVVRWDAALDDLVPTNARIEKLAEGFTWSEGPAWIAGGQYLLFTDVPENTMYRWSESEGLSVFLKPSGYDGPDLGILREPGANGLFAVSNGEVLLADSGSRLIARLDLATKTKMPIASSVGGLRFNSPNDVVRRTDGVVFFTDPPYGLKHGNASPAKELSYNGVYRIDTDGSVHLIDDQLSFPNGIELSPDERTLYVANSDPERPIWMAYTLNDRGAVVSKRVFADVSDLVGEDNPGLPDGMSVSVGGHVFATGPGGVLIFSPEGKRLGLIQTGAAIANCAFGDDGRTLYMTSHKFIARVRLSTHGVGFPRYAGAGISD
jgi:gluconolactonase